MLFLIFLRNIKALSNDNVSSKCAVVRLHQIEESKAIRTKMDNSNTHNSIPGVIIRSALWGSVIKLDELGE